MSKTKKSKLLASMLCATVVAGLYAGPVMAENSIANSNGTSSITVNDGITIEVLNQHIGDYSIRDNHALFNFYGTISANSLTGDELVVEGSSGSFKVKDIPDGNGGSTMVYTSAKDGTNTMWLDTATGNLSTVGTVSIGGELGGTAKVVIDGETGSIKVGNELFAVDGTNGNAKLEGELIVNNGLVAGTDGSGTFKVKNIDGNTMAYMVDKDGNYTVGINAQNGNIETKGALAVTNAEGNNVFTANSNGMSVGNGNFAVNAATGDTKIAGGLNVGTNVEVAGGITASSLTLGEMNVGDAITDLQGEIGNVGGDLTDLTGKVGTLETNTAGITNDKGVTVIDKGLKVKGEDGREVFSVARDGAINAVVTDGLGGTSANFALNGENVELKYGNNGITANINGTTISGNGTDVVVNENGATFTKANGTTVINGGAITAETLNGKNIDELISGVDVTNANVAGITRDGETTTIEETLSVSKDGISANVGSSQLIVNDEVAGMTSGNASLALTNNEASLSAAGNSVVVNHDGVTFNTTNNGTTVINGGAITADTLNGADIDELIASVGTIGETNKNTAGIERKEVQTIDGTGYATVIEDGTVIGSDGSFSTAFGKLTVEKDGRFSLSSDAWFGGDVNYKYVNKDGSISYGSLQDLTDRVSDLEDKTQNIDSGSTHGPSEPGEGEGPVDNGAHTGINGDVTVGGDANVKGDVNVDGNVNVGDKTQIGNGNITVDNGESGKVEIGNGDVTVTDKDGNKHSIQGNAEAIEGIREDMGAMSNRISKVEDRIDKVGAMSAAIANLRTMGYDPTAPTEIAVGLGQYRSETGAALGLFHYPNKDFMLSLSVSTSGDEVMGGIGATWKFGRKSPEQMLAAEKEKAAKAKLAKAEAMKKAAAEAKVAEQQAKHAKMAAEKAAK